MNAVWKFPIPLEDVFEIEMPRVSKPLSVQVQKGIVQIWALVTPGRDIVKRRFYLCGTGHPREDIPRSLNFVGTFQLGQGNLVFHLFDGGEIE